MLNVLDPTSKSNYHKAGLEALSCAFEAALDPRLWPEALQQLAEACGARSAILSYSDDASKGALSPYFNQISTDFPGKALMEYLSKFERFELDAFNRTREVEPGPDGFALVTDDMVYAPYELHKEAIDFRKSELGIYRAVGSVLNPRNPWYDGFFCQFEAGLTEFPDGALERINELSPYVARAVASARPLSMLRSKYGAALDVLDRLAVGCAVVAADRSVVFANRAFARILELNPALQLDPRNALLAINPEQNAALAAGIRNAALVSVGRLVGRGAHLNLTRTDNAHPISLEIYPLTPIRGETPKEGWAILYAVDPDWCLTLDAHGLQNAYALTDSEKEVCDLLLAGHTNPEIADARNVSPGTIRTQVLSLFSKTHSKNRTDLARIAAMQRIPVLD